MLACTLVGVFGGVTQAEATLGAAVKYHEDQLRVQRDVLPDLLARLG